MCLGRFRYKELFLKKSDAKYTVSQFTKLCKVGFPMKKFRVVIFAFFSVAVEVSILGSQLGTHL